MLISLVLVFPLSHNHSMILFGILFFFSLHFTVTEFEEYLTFVSISHNTNSLKGDGWSPPKRWVKKVLKRIVPMTGQNEGVGREGTETVKGMAVLVQKVLKNCVLTEIISLTVQ